jgi:DivIVA domain-containing protein
VIVFLVLVLVVLVGLVVALVLGRLGGRGEALAAPTSTSPFEPLPEGLVDPDHVRDVRFDIGLRGYRMDQVDATLDRLVGELRSRDEELAALRDGSVRHAAAAPEVHGASDVSGVAHAPDALDVPDVPDASGVSDPSTRR